jgi:iron-sulfur cluster repair protein YtfE (RIC family)
MPDLVQSPVEVSHPQIAGGDSATMLSSLQKYYTILDDDRLVTKILSEEPALYSLLMEAAGPLQKAFGEKRILQLRGQTSDEDRMLNAVVRVSADFGDPEGALRAFDAAWWLDNCHRSGGALVFDYEMQDAV